MRKLLFSGDSSKGSLVILVTKLFRFVSNSSVHVCKHWLDFVILSSFFFSVFIDMEVSCVSPSESICFLINFIAFRQKFPQSLEQNRILKICFASNSYRSPEFPVERYPSALRDYLQFSKRISIRQ